MFDFRTKFVTGLVWGLAAIQLVTQPAAGLLHSGCQGHSHDPVCIDSACTSVQPVAQLLGQSIEDAWHWVCHAVGCQHSHADNAAAITKYALVQSHQCSASCAHCSPAEFEADDSSHQPRDTSVPPHDSHQCPICQVVFAARLNVFAVQVPEQTDLIELAVVAVAPAVEIAPRFRLPTRGPPGA